MTAHDLLSQLRANGVDIKTSGDDRLVIDAPRGTVTDDLRTALSANKAALIKILKDEEARARAVSNAPQVTAAPEPAPVARTPQPAQPMPPAPKAHQVATPKDEIADSTAEEIAQLRVELETLRSEEASRRAEIDGARMAAEDGLRAEQALWHEQEEEIARRRAEHERQRIEREARDRAEEDKRRQIAEAEIGEAQKAMMRLRGIEENRRREAAERMRGEQESHEAKLASLRKAEEQQARRRADEERNYLEDQARRRAQEDELRRRAEMRFRAIEEEIDRVQAREDARLKAETDAQRIIEEAERRRVEGEMRRQAEARALLKSEEEARLRAEIEAELRAEVATRRREEEEVRRRAEEEARRRAEGEAQRLAAEQAQRRVEEEAQRRAEAESRRQSEEAARMQAQEEARRQAEIQTRLRAEQAERDRQVAESRERAELEARIRAEVEAKLRAEDEDRRREEVEARRREQYLAEEVAHAQDPIFPLADKPNGGTESIPNAREITPWFESGVEVQKEIESSHQSIFQDSFTRGPTDNESEFRAVSLPDEAESFEMTSDLQHALRSNNPVARASAIAELPRVGGEDAYHRITTAFDDPSPEVRSSAARALFDLQPDRAATFTRALREAEPERRRAIGAAISSSGLANEAISNLTGESRDKTYDAFSLLFLMSKAGEVRPLMRAIEEHPNAEVRLAVIKLLALSGQPEVLSAFRRMAVRGSLPAEVRSAVMEAIYQITSQSSAETN
jgi:hypothetical protein